MMAKTMLRLAGARCVAIVTLFLLAGMKAAGESANFLQYEGSGETKNFQNFDANSSSGGSSGGGSGGFDLDPAAAQGAGEAVVWGFGQLWKLGKKLFGGSKSHQGNRASVPGISQVGTAIGSSAYMRWMARDKEINRRHDAYIADVRKNKKKLDNRWSGLGQRPSDQMIEDDNKRRAQELSDSYQQYLAELQQEFNQGSGPTPSVASYWTNVLSKWCSGQQVWVAPPLQHGSGYTAGIAPGVNYWPAPLQPAGEATQPQRGPGQQVAPTSRDSHPGRFDSPSAAEETSNITSASGPSRFDSLPASALAVQQTVGSLSGEESTIAPWSGPSRFDSPPPASPAGYPSTQHSAQPTWENSRVDSPQQLHNQPSPSCEVVIPLDPGAGGRSIGRDELMAGDVIVSKEDTLKSSAIRAVTQGQVSHAYLVVDVSPDHKTVQVVEAVGDGVRLGEISSSLSTESLAVVLRNKSLNAEQRRHIADYATDKVGRKYDYSAVLIGLPTAGLLTRGSTDKFFCSDLVSRAYEAAHAPLLLKDSKNTSPADIADQNQHGELSYIGHLKTSP